MSLKNKGLYKFGGFSFNAEENVLRCQDKPLPLTPKMLDLLRVLIEHHGQIIKKTDLMSKVWNDSFVEEGNLTFNIRQLRKTLNDDAHHPTYIETVARQGYRFIAEVEEVPVSPITKNGFTITDSLKSTKLLFSVLAVCLLCISVILLGSWYIRSKSAEAAAPILSAPFAAEKLSTTGKVVHAVISPDGKNIVYTNGIGGKTSIWLRQLESSNNVEIIPPSDDVYGGLDLSPDGNFLYFSRRPHGFVGQLDIYRVSIFGGVPTKIVSETQGNVSVSVDGQKISFRRCYYREDEYCSLWIADARDGKNERKILSRPSPMRIGDNEISPDGRTIAFASGQSKNGASEFGLFEVDLETGAERELTTEKFFNVQSLSWLPDQSGWLITASKVPNTHFRVWQISRLTGAASPLTKDSETYAALSLDKQAELLVSTQVKRDLRLYRSSLANPAERQVLTGATNVVLARNGKIFFSSDMSGNDEIWSMNANDGEYRQLTNNPADDNRPIVSADKNWVFFASNRSGEVHVWRMNADGSNQMQITQKEGGFPVFASPDGQWIYYHHGLKRTLWRVSAEGGEERQILNIARYLFAFSPDGLQVAYSEKQTAEGELTIASAVDGQVLKTFPVADKNTKLKGMDWTPDGKSVIYILADSEFKNNILWRQSLDGGKPEQITGLGEEGASSLSISPDGKSFAYIQGDWRHDAVLLKGLR